MSGILGTGAAPALTSPMWIEWPSHLGRRVADLEAAAREGRRGVLVGEPVEVTPDGDAGAAAFVALLRESARLGLAIRWRGSVRGIPHELVRHLSAPYVGQTGRFTWRRPGRVGLRLRRGPGFLTVEDRRYGPVRRTVVPDCDERFAALSPRADAELLPVLDPAVSARLRSDGLAVAIGDRLVTLPVHLR
ncbi:DUF5825 family protein [Phytohabitans kaempferiae]|uniref:DUF5825 family protein n=1 Tax=Phytohabitans kaempferiae TaxID=1620943 RepID=A0ABV6M5I9_9ACTN